MKKRQSIARGEAKRLVHTSVKQSGMNVRTASAGVLLVLGSRALQTQQLATMKHNESKPAMTQHVAMWKDQTQTPPNSAMSFTAIETCGEGELVSGVHTLVAGVVQVYHRLQVVEEEEKVRKVEQEVEREDQGEETARMTMHMEMT